MYVANDSVLFSTITAGGLHSRSVEYWHTTRIVEAGTTQSAVDASPWSSPRLGGADNDLVAAFESAPVHGPAGETAFIVTTPETRLTRSVHGQDVGGAVTVEVHPPSPDYEGRRSGRPEPKCR